MKNIPPEIAYENAINDAVARYDKLKSITASMITRRNDVAGQVEQEKAELETLSAQLDAAVAADEDDEALLLLSTKQSLETRVGNTLAELGQAEVDVDQAKASLVSLKEEIEKLKVERHTVQTKLANVSMQDQLDGLSVDAELVALENVRSHIKETVALAELNRELADGDPDRQLAALRKKEDPEALARAQLAALKKARAEKKTKPKKTM